MKKLITGLAIGITVLGLTSAIAMAESDDLNNLQAIIRQLQEKIRVMTPTSNQGLINKIEKFENKLEGMMGMKILPERKKVGKPALNIEELGNGDVQVNLKNGLVTEIDRTNKAVKIKVFSMAFTVKLMPGIEILSAERANALIDNYAVGDYVNVLGTQDKNDPTLINGKIIRNVSVLKKEIKEREKICVQIIVKAQKLATGEMKEFPNPCAVPEGWKIIGKVESTIITPTATSTVQ